MFDAITYALSKAFTKKAIAEADAGNMKIEDYDTEGNGVVNDSRKLGGNLPSYYASTASIVGKMDKSVYDINDNGIVDNAEKVNNHTVASDVPANAEFTDTKNLSDLQDTDFNNLADGETIVYNAATQKFKNGAVSGGVGKDLTGQTVEPTQGTTYTAGTNAEIFNDYRERQFNATTGDVTQGNVAVGNYSHAEGSNTTAKGSCSHAEGTLTIANGDYTHAEGYGSKATVAEAHAEGYNTTASITASHAEGQGTTASGMASHAEGCATVASSRYAHAEGYKTEASSLGAHAEGYIHSDYPEAYIKASNNGAHAEGYSTDAIIASGPGAHAEGWNTRSGGYGSHSEGIYTQASSDGSHAGGIGAQGSFVKTEQKGQFLHGNWEEKKFPSESINHGTGITFSFHCITRESTASEEIGATNGVNGYSGTISKASTITLRLKYEAIYILVANSYNLSTKAIRGACAYMIVAGAQSMTPGIVSLGTTGTPPVVAGSGAATEANGGLITIKNESASYCTQYNLIRVA